MRTIYRTRHVIPLFVDYGRGRGKAKYITHSEAFKLAAEDKAVIVDDPDDPYEKKEADDERIRKARLAGQMPASPQPHTQGEW